MKYLTACLLVLVISGNSLGNSIAKDTIQAQSAKHYSSAMHQSFPTQVYWGDTHVHTNLSSDAFGWENQSFGPDIAYRFAKGEAITALNGMLVQRGRPLDFVVIADHANSMGLMVEIANNKDSSLFDTSLGKSWLKLLKGRTIQEAMKTKSEAISNISDAMWLSNLDEVKDTSLKIWQSALKIGDLYNQPGKFTTFLGFEWTPWFNLHRVVIFKDGEDLVGSRLPLSSYISSDPEELWRYLMSYEVDTGGEVIAIPHNANLSQGVMFALENTQGQPLSNTYAQTRMRWEPLLEVTQMKGDSETHPLLSPEDEFSGYERINSMDAWSWITTVRKDGYQDYKNWYDRRKQEEPNDNWMRPYEYARSALKLGLAEQDKIGANPFKFGMIGSTDTHTSLSTAEENNFWGKLSPSLPSSTRIKDAWDGTSVKSKMGEWWGPGWKQNAAGYAAVWAEENTRESLFAAMKRKEVYASTGPRITVRFFGGWDYQADDAFKPDLARIGYSKGVPMGGDLTSAPGNQPPQFLIRAIKDPDGANLDRVQVIKGWHDLSGELHEKIYDVALSDHRKPNWRGKIKPVGNTVDIPDASYTNTIGDPELAVVWQDPDFDKNELAFYYLRVLEIPTPRWTAYDAKYFGLKDLAEEIPMITQERAYSSPIWYTPGE